MDFSLSVEQQSIRAAVARLCADFTPEYWLAKDETGNFPHEFHAAMASAGWLGIAMPAAYGGAGLGITEAALMMQEVAASGAGFSGASSIHMNIFGLNPVVVFGSAEQKDRFLPPLIAGKEKACFAVTEPDAGLDTTHLTTRAVRAMGRTAVDSNMLFIDGLRVPEADRIGGEGEGFKYILHGMNPERILIAAEAIGLGQAALQRACAYAGERVVFGRKIGQNQAIQHPLAQNWMELRAAELMMLDAAGKYDRGEPCGAEANAAKYLAAEAGFRACETAIMTHGGFGYAREYHVERYLREMQIARIAPITPHLILCHIAEKVLGLPRSY